MVFEKNQFQLTFRQSTNKIPSTVLFKLVSLDVHNESGYPNIAQSIYTTLQMLFANRLLSCLWMS